MRKSRGDTRTTRAASTAAAFLSPNRMVVLAFLISVSLPIGWGLAAEGRRPMRVVEDWPAAPETTEELLALAAKAPTFQQQPAAETPAELTVIADESPRPASGLDELVPTFESSLTPSEIYSRAPHGLWQNEIPAGVNAPKAEEPAAVEVAAKQQRRMEPVLLAQADLVRAGATSAQAAATEPAPAPRAAANASTPSTITAAPVLQETRPQDRAKPAGPEPVTRKELEDARRARAMAQAGAAAPRTTRRSVAMHRMAAAAASSLNEATPFRTSGSGADRFSGVSGEAIGDGLDRVAEAVSIVPGLRLENVSLSAGYTSNGLPGARGLYGLQSGLGSDVDLGARATLAFRKRFRHSSFGLTYTPSRSQRQEFTQWNTTDHVFGIEFDRQIGRRWGLAVNAGAADTGLEQFWFRQPVYTRVENPPTTLEELLERAQAGEFTDDELASLLTGAPIVKDPGGRELDLTRVHSLNSSATMTYAASARNTFTFGVGATKYETAARFGNRSSSNGFAISDISRKTGYFQSAYKFSPTLTTGVRYNFNDNDSSFGLSQAHQMTAYIRKRLSRFWSAEMSGGAGYVTRDPNSGFFQTLEDRVLSRPTWVAGGSLQYRYGGHAFRTFARRQAGDSLGLSSTSSFAGGLAWQWTTPRMPWVFSGSAQYTKSDYGFRVFDNTSRSYETTLLEAGLTRRISPSTQFTTGYYFGRYASPFTGLLTGTSVHRVQATFLWRPVENF